MRTWGETNLTAGLTPLQRLHRLWTFGTGSGAYTHPDGHIELDFEEAAGIDSRVDSEERQETLLVLYEQRKHQRELSGSRILGASILGMVAASLLNQLAGLPWGECAGYGVMVALGFYYLSHE